MYSLSLNFNIFLRSSVLGAGIIAIEGRARHNDHIRTYGNSTDEFSISYFAPNINLVRDVRWGRAQETYGECPHLTARMAIAMVKGIQNQTLRPALSRSSRYLSGLAMLKHYVAYDVESNFAAGGTDPQYRLRFTANISSADLRQTFAPAFEAAITEGNAGSLMCQYSSISVDGGVALPMCAHPLLKEGLRTRLKFDGYIMSDGGALNFMVTTHHAYNNTVQAAAAAMDATCDINSGVVYSAAALQQAINQKLITRQHHLAPALKRIFTKRFELGTLDATQYDHLTASADVDTPAHRQIARDMAAASFVLLKNEDGFLPLRVSTHPSHERGEQQRASGAPLTPYSAPTGPGPTTRGSLHGVPHTIALLGPNADSAEALVGGYAGCTSSQENDLKNTARPFILNPECHLVTPRQGFERALNALSSNRSSWRRPPLMYASGSNIVTPDHAGFLQAVSAAEVSDVAVVVLGLRSCTFANEYPGPIEGSDRCQEDEAHDRNSTGLPAVQITLLRALAASSTPIALVIMSGSAVSLPADIIAHPRIKAIAWSSYGGEEAGNGTWGCSGV